MSNKFFITASTIMLLAIGLMIYDINKNKDQKQIEGVRAALPPNAQNLIYEKPGWYSFTVGNKKFYMQQTYQEYGYVYEFIEVTE